MKNTIKKLKNKLFGDTWVEISDVEVVLRFYTDSGYEIITEIVKVDNNKHFSQVKAVSFFIEAKVESSYDEINVAYKVEDYFEEKYKEEINQLMFRKLSSKHASGFYDFKDKAVVLYGKHIVKCEYNVSDYHLRVFTDDENFVKNNG
jgi:hypothetical protein